MRAPAVKKRNHSGLTIRAPQETYEKMGPVIFTKASSRQIAKDFSVNRKTVQAWRKCANAAEQEFGDLLKFPSALANYKRRFIRNNPTALAKELKVSKEAVKGLEIILSAKGLLKGSRVDNIKIEMRQWDIKDKKRLMAEYGLGRSEAEAILKGTR